MKQFMLTIMLLRVLNAEWIQIDKKFTTATIDVSGWTYYYLISSGWCQDDLAYGSCSTNNLQYADINFFHYNKSVLFTNTYYQKGVLVQLIFDVSFIEAHSSMYSTHQVRQEPSGYNIYQIQYLREHLTQYANRICIGGADFPFDSKTIIVIDIHLAHGFLVTFNNTEASMDLNVLRFSFVGYFQNTASTIWIRNILTYVNACYPKCATCQSANPNYCLTCYYGSPALGQCSCHPQHQFSQTFIGCRQECPMDYFTSDSNYICVPDRRITSKYQYLQGDYVYSNALPKYSPFIFIPYKVRSLINGLAFNCINGPDFIGYSYFNEGASLQIPTISALTFIRLRVTFYILYLQEGSKILMKLDSATCAEVMKTSTGYTFNNAINIFTDTLDCPPIFTRIRIETILRTQSLQPKLVMEGQLQNGEESWGFYNVTIDAGLCSEHSSVCSSFSTCQQCESGYVLYQHGCVSSCPIYSQNCIDYSDEYPYSRYLAKGFYDINMTLEDVNSFYDSVTNTATNFKTDQKFSFIPEKIVLGGVMVWNDAAYIKTFIISQPHYAFTIRFNMTFGDEYSREFYYFIDSISYGPFTKPISGGQNLVGKSEVERTSFFYIYLNPQTSPTFELKLECKNTGSLDLRDGFCAISEYFIVVHYCLPFCDACTSSSVCTIWQSGYTSSQCATGQYLSFNSQTSTYSCEACRPDCQTCNSWDECTTCSKFYSLYSNLCICYNVEQFHRKFKECTCQSGYYDDGYSFPCLPICGDQIIVDGEDCDDGNSYSFDGCDQCISSNNVSYFFFF